MVRGNPKEVLPRLFVDWKVSHLTFETDTEPYSKQRDALAEIQCKQYKVEIIQKTSHTIFDPNVIIRNNLGKAPTQYQRFLSIAEGLRAPDPIPTPKRLQNRSIPSPDLHEQHDPNCYDCPTLAELLVDTKLLGPNLYPGGETEGIRRMQRYLKDQRWVCAFEKPNTSPNSLEPSTTVLSPYLKFGCLSSRLFYQELKTIIKSNKNHSKPPVSLIGQVMWREFYYVNAASEPNYDRMQGNSICRQIPWTFNADLLAAWTHGQTGYPFIDAVMRQLRQEGWIHHLARHSVACFLTRGDLWISWEEGQKVFEELLLDADYALNAGNWMWLSASAYFYQYFRVYSPVAFGKKTDKNGDYIRKYVPELRLYPANLVYEPWKASPQQQKQYKCVLGQAYPHRVVIHEVVSKTNMGRMAAAYKKHKEGGGASSSDEEKKKNKKPFLLVKKEKKESPPSPSLVCASSTSFGLPAKRSRILNAKSSTKSTNLLTNYFKKEPEDDSD